MSTKRYLDKVPALIKEKKTAELRLFIQKNRDHIMKETSLALSGGGLAHMFVACKEYGMLAWLLQERYYKPFQITDLNGRTPLQLAKFQFPDDKLFEVILTRNSY